MYEELLKNGHSSGDNLLGFVIDVEAYLEDREVFTNIKVDSTQDIESLIVATCKYNHPLTEKEVSKIFEEIWENDLRYQEFEKHSIEVSDGKVIFYFCTTSGALGVTGKITANRT